MKIRKTLIYIIVSFVSFMFFSIESIHAATANTLVIHYKRYDESYDDWSMWIWKKGSEGSDYYFQSTDDYGAVSVITLTGTELENETEVGIIVKNGSIQTGQKDVSSDRFINLSLPNLSGEVHAYLLEAEPFISYVKEDTLSCDRSQSSIDPYQCAQDLTPRILSAFFDDDFKVSFQVSHDVTKEQIKVRKNGLNVTYTGFETGTSGLITLDEPIDYTAFYQFFIEDEENTIYATITFGADYDSTVFNDVYNYDGWLGFQYGENETTFRLWAPVSQAVSINLYEKGHRTTSRSDGVNDPYETLDMTYLEKGVWEITISGDLHEVYYTFNVNNNGAWVNDIADPYGVTFGLNGARSMVIDFDQANPEGWDDDEGVKGYAHPNDMIIYELHVRDLTSQNAWGGPTEYQGKFMGLTVRETSYTNPINDVTVTTGLDHLIELGITHLHLLPTYDQDGWNNEANFQFNWGYNPQNFNSPEGGYSTDPYNGSVRVNEFKQMVMALHSNGINIILDKVYNHTGNGAAFSFNKIVPNYIYRLNSDGSFSNGTGVGNETASERYMFRKFMIDSAVFWAEEYHIDGLRFDLMAVHDVETMNLLTDAVKAVNPEIHVYGEPWGGGTIALPYHLQAGKNNIKNMPQIAAFNDQFRDTIKGSTGQVTSSGYVTNGMGIDQIKRGIEGSTNWNWGNTSSQSINYVSAHDNHTLYDKLIRVNNVSSYTEAVDYQARLSNSIVLFSQGVPFLHAGVDFLRTKGGDHNSYESSDLVNQLNWVRKSLYNDSFEYYKGIIDIRKHFDSFKMIEVSDIQTHLQFLNLSNIGTVGYRLNKNDEDILVFHNAYAQVNDLTLPEGAWSLIANRDQAGLESLGTFETRYPIQRAETLVFIKGDANDVQPSPTLPPEITNTIQTIFTSGSFVLRTSSAVTAYRINEGDFIELTSPSNQISLGQFEVGTYTITVKNEFNQISEPFTLNVIQSGSQITPPEIINEQNVFEYGLPVTIVTSKDIIKYSVNGEPYIELSFASSEIVLHDLETGIYEMTVMDINNLESEVFTFNVSVNEGSDQDPVESVNIPLILGLSTLGLAMIGGGSFYLFKFRKK